MDYWAPKIAQCLFYTMGTQCFFLASLLDTPYEKYVNMAPLTLSNLPNQLNKLSMSSYHEHLVHQHNLMILSYQS